MHVYFKKILYLIKSSLDPFPTLPACLLVSFDNRFFFSFGLVFLHVHVYICGVHMYVSVSMKARD